MTKTLFDDDQCQYMGVSILGGGLSPFEELQLGLETAAVGMVVLYI
uniref:Uncharacterized protein n=1 Tax=Romanomermis culicivorax TaxID=13658 RepID=A0A915IX94_ROMCU